MERGYMERGYPESEPTRAEVDSLPGATVLEFGTDWCGYCRAARQLIADALAGLPELRHIRVADGPGKPLGRSFRVKLWPTLVFLKDGREIVRVVRPGDADGLRQALRQIA